jgi:hypothetical protein
LPTHKKRTSNKKITQFINIQLKAQIKQKLVQRIQWSSLNNHFKPYPFVKHGNLEGPSDVSGIRGSGMLKIGNSI